MCASQCTTIFSSVLFHFLHAKYASLPQHDTSASFAHAKHVLQPVDSRGPGDREGGYCRSALFNGSLALKPSLPLYHGAAGDARQGADTVASLFHYHSVREEVALLLKVRGRAKTAERARDSPSYKLVVLTEEDTADKFAVCSCANSKHAAPIVKT